MVNSFRFKKAELGVFQDIDSDKAVINLKKDCRIIGLTNGKFSLIDLIYSILKKIGKSDLIVATWSAGIKDTHQVKWMIDSDLINNFKLLTDHSYKTRQSKYAASIEELFGLENIRTSEMHAKFVLIKNNEYKITIRSSMNLNANKTTELFEIDEGFDIYNFLNNYVNHTFENMELGFVSEHKKVSDCVSGFFKKNTKENLKINWWDINNKTE